MKELNGDGKLVKSLVLMGGGFQILLFTSQISSGDSCFSSGDESPV